VARNLLGERYGLEIRAGPALGVVRFDGLDGSEAWRWETIGAFVEEMMGGALYAQDRGCFGGNGRMTKEI
jgi:hypothetical protein